MVRDPWMTCQIPHNPVPSSLHHCPINPECAWLSLQVKMPAECVTVALDWTPNTNHAGFLVAKAKGMYSERGLNVSFLSPHKDNYSTTPASKLLAGVADLAICPSETVISHNTPPRTSPLLVSPKRQTRCVMVFDVAHDIPRNPSNSPAGRCSCAPERHQCHSHVEEQRH
jgi:hypothetical protein